MPCIETPAVATCPGPIFPSPNPDVRCSLCQAEAMTERFVPAALAYPDAQASAAACSSVVPAETRRRMSTPDAGLATTPAEFITRLLDAGLLCRAGSRKLFVDNPGEKDKGVELLRANNLGRIVDADTKNVTLMYSTLGTLNQAIRNGKVSAEFRAILTKPRAACKAEKTFQEWAMFSIGSCGEQVSAECLDWAATIAIRAGLPFDHKHDIERAQAQGTDELGEYCRLQREHGAVTVLRKPDIAEYQRKQGLQQPMDEYLAALYRMNSDLPFQQLRQAWTQERRQIIDEYMAAEDGDLRTWDVMHAARGRPLPRTSQPQKK